MWVDGSQCLFQTRNQDGDVVVDQGVLGFKYADVMRKEKS
jgi:hypothetical protein